MATKQENELTANAKTLGKILGISDRRVQQLKEDGLFEQVGRGKYDIPKCTQSYIAYKMETVKHETEQVASGLEAEKIKLTRAKRLIEEKKYQIMKGDLHRSSTVKAVMNRMLSNFKGKIQALPIMVAPKVLGETSLPIIQERISESVIEALNELSEYDPDLFYDESEDIIVQEDVEFDDEGNVVGDSHE